MVHAAQWVVSQSGGGQKSEESGGEHFSKVGVLFGVVILAKMSLDLYMLCASIISLRNVRLVTGSNIPIVEDAKTKTEIRRTRS